MKTKLNDIYKSIKSREDLQRYFKGKPVIKAYLFGSAVRGHMTEDSDLDILVELDYSKRIGLQFIDMKLELEELLNHKVDLVSAEALSRKIRPYVDSEKQLIYARQA